MTEVPDWVTVTPDSGTGVMDVTVSVTDNMRDGAEDNPRKATLVFKGRTLASRAQVLITQNGDKYRDVKEYTAGELAALADETVISVPSAIVVAVTTKGFVISDDKTRTISSSRTPRRLPSATRFRSWAPSRPTRRNSLR